MKVRFLGGPRHWLVEDVSPLGEFIYIPVIGNNEFKYRVLPPGIYQDHVDAIAVPAKFDCLWEWRANSRGYNRSGESPVQ